MGWLYAKLTPNNEERSALGSSAPLKLQIIKPQKLELTDVVVKVFEQDKFYRSGKWRSENATTGSNDLIATLEARSRAAS